ncbi:hypothetical protein [Pedobacter cryophilus]|uniref:Uncharacterized protein n=1 Tax=Pedobacter cryophilus TaxID=2571271 RepID=A0A4U1C6E8_9SPHI|nr:hypothetical protein [Pedobacter cryophilus]TKC00962.1 hypothetical protein FA046_04595 [Pedobacter cryophilus]
MDFNYIIFPLIYSLINVFFIFIIHSFIKKRIDDKVMAWSYSISISLGITFILTILFLMFFAKDLFKY